MLVNLSKNFFPDLKDKDFPPEQNICQLQKISGLHLSPPSPLVSFQFPTFKKDRIGEERGELALKLSRERKKPSKSQYSFSFVFKIRKHMTLCKEALCTITRSPYL